MSAGVTDQRMKGQGNQVANGPKEHVNEHEDFDSWRAQQHQGYTTGISTTMGSDPYLPNYYGTSFQYQTFGVGDATWSTNSDAMTFLGSYGGQIQHDSYGMDGMFGGGGGFGQAAGPPTTFSYFPGNGDYSTWGSSAPISRKPHYDDYYRHGDPIYPSGEGLKGIEHGMGTLGLAETGGKPEVKEAKEVKKMSWATIASQPAKPPLQSSSTGIKKKGPGMPPGPMVPGKHNMDIGTWGGGDGKGGGGNKSGWTGGGGGPRGGAPTFPYLRHPPPPPLILPPPPPVQQPPLPQHHPHSIVSEDKSPHLNSLKQISPMGGSEEGLIGGSPAQLQSQTSIPSHPILDELRIKNNYNPVDFDLSAKGARFFVIKSYSEDDIHRSIKYEIWCSTEHGNKRLDQAYRDQESKGGVVYLFFSVNGSGHFCGMAKMTSPVDYNASSSVWSQDKWKGQFRVRWIYVKDVPNTQLRHIRLENNENKPVTNSRDTQEVPFERGKQVLKVLHAFRHTTSIFDDFIHYERRQEEEDSKKEAESAVHHTSHHKEREGRSGRAPRGGRTNPN